jgi:hypothetical protein
MAASSVVPTQQVTKAIGRLLNAAWPPGLDPATVPFLTRSVTIPPRMGYTGDPPVFAQRRP